MHPSKVRKSRLFRQADTMLGKTATAMAVATGASLCGFTQQAEAQIVYSGVVNIPIAVNIDGVYLNVITGQTGTAGASVPGWDINPYSGTSLQFFSPANPANTHGAVRGLGNDGTLVDNLPLGTLVDATNPAPGPNYISGVTNVETAGPTAFAFNADNYIGFRFYNEDTLTTNYGWMRIALGGSFTDPARNIVDYAYDASGAGIQIGAVPEPSSLALLSLGAAGLATYRRRRAQKSETVA